MSIVTHAAHRLRGPSGRALAGTLVGNAPGFVLAFAVTAHIGAGRVTDAYAFAWSIGLFGIALASTLLEANVLPAAQLARRAGRAPFLRLVRRTALQGVGGSAAAYTVIAALAALFVTMHGGWTAGQGHAALVVIAELGVLVVVVAVNSVCAAGLYALDEFLLPTFSQAFRAAVPLCALPFLGAGYATIETLALLAIVGEAARSVLLATVVRRRSRALADGEAVPEGVTSVWRAMAPHAINMVIVAVNPVVDRAVASSLAPGSVTVIDLAEKVSYVPTLILMSSVVLVAGARWSAAFERPSDLLKDYRRTTRLALAASSALAIVFGACVVVLGLVSGPKTAGADTALLVTVTLVLLVGLPGAAVASLGSRLLTSTQRTGMLPAFAVSAFVLNLVGDVVGARLFGPVGIAGATVVMRSVNAALFVVYATRLVAGLSATRSTRTRGDAQAPRLAAEATR